MFEKTLESFKKILKLCENFRKILENLENFKKFKKFCNLKN